jgi:hypothetical protein
VPVTPPKHAACQLSWDGTTLVIVEPRVHWKALLGLPLLLLVVLGLPCVGFGVFAHFFEARHAVNLDPILESAIVVEILVVMLAASVVASLPQLGRRHVVTADRTGLVFKSEGLFATTFRHMRSQDIGELRIALGHLAAITPRDCRIVFGTVDNLLSREELEWLRFQLVRALKG